MSPKRIFSVEVTQRAPFSCPCTDQTVNGRSWTCLVRLAMLRGIVCLLLDVWMQNLVFLAQDASQTMIAISYLMIPLVEVSWYNRGPPQSPPSHCLCLPFML